MIPSTKDKEIIVKKIVSLPGALTAGVCSLFLTAAAKPSAVPAAAPTPPTYLDVAPIFADNCQFCHTGGLNDAPAGVSLDTEAEVLLNVKAIYEAVSVGYMPYGDPDWRFTPDGVKLLEYAKNQIGLEKTPK